MAFKSNAVVLAVLLGAVGARAGKWVVVSTWASGGCSGPAQSKIARPLGVCSNHLGQWVMWHEVGDNVVQSNYATDVNCSPSSFQWNQTKPKTCNDAGTLAVIESNERPIYFRVFSSNGCTGEVVEQGTVMSGYCNIGGIISSKVTCTSAGFSFEKFPAKDCSGAADAGQSAIGNGDGCAGPQYMVQGCPLGTGVAGGAGTGGGDGSVVISGAAGVGAGTAALLSAAAAAFAAAAGSGI